MVDPRAAVIAALTVAVALIIAPTIIGAMADQAIQSGANEARDTAVLLNGTTAVTLDSGRGTDETVRDSRGYALRFSGADDSYLSSTQPVPIGANDTWTVSQGVWINNSATGANQTLLAAGDDLILRYLGNKPTQEWQAVYTDPGKTYRVNVSATTPTTASIIQVVRDNSTLAIYRNNSLGESITMNASNETVGGNITKDSNLDGQLDETRFFNSSLTSADRQALVNDEVGPLPGTDRTARLMYDAGTGSGVRVFFSPASATASNVTWADGFGGQVLSGISDYEWETDGPTVRARAGGEIDGAPVAYVAYEFDGEEEISIVVGVADALSLMAIVPLLLILGAVLTVVGTVQNMRF